MKALAFAAALTIAGCAPPPDLPDPGKEAAPPIGHVLHCEENPESVFCE